MEFPHLHWAAGPGAMATGIPVGSVIAFAGKVSGPVNPADQPGHTTVTESQGWLVCDGRPVKQALYGALHAAIGDQYNTGNEPEGTFCLPDYRGYFLRMVTMSTTNDPDAKDRLLANKTQSDEVGSIQEDALQLHQHVYDKPGMPVTPGGGQGAGVVTVTPDLTGDPTNVPPTSNPGDNTVRTSTETRAKNVYVYYLIKFI